MPMMNAGGATDPVFEMARQTIEMVAKDPAGCKKRLAELQAEREAGNAARNEASALAASAKADRDAAEVMRKDAETAAQAAAEKMAEADDKLKRAAAVFDAMHLALGKTA